MPLLCIDKRNPRRFVSKFCIIAVLTKLSFRFKMITKHIHLDLDINFDKKILSGFCVLTMEKVDATGKVLTT